MPLGDEASIAVEHLDTVVFPVGNVDETVRIAGDIVNNVELARIGTELTPR